MRRSQENHIGYLIQQIAHLLDQSFNEKLENEGVTISQARVIYLLYNNDGVTQSELQQDLFIKPSSLTKLIDVLEYKGLVTRESGGKDARIRRIYLTDTGRRKEERLLEIKEAMEVHLGQFLSEYQLSALIEKLKMVRKTLI